MSSLYELYKSIFTYFVHFILQKIRIFYVHVFSNICAQMRSQGFQTKVVVSWKGERGTVDPIQNGSLGTPPPEIVEIYY